MSKPRKPRRKRWRILLGAVGLLSLLAWAAPKIVAQTSLLNWLVARNAKELQGTVTVGRASLGWLAPVVLEGIEVRDRLGRPVLTVPKIESGKSLLGLLMDPSNPGTFRCQGAAFDIECSGRTTNLEEMLAHWLKRKDDEPKEGSLDGVAVTVEAADARLTLHDADTNENWSFHPMDLNLTLPRHWSDSMQLQFRSTLEDAGQPGAIEAKLVMSRVATRGGSSTSAGRLNLRVDSLPLAMAKPALRRTVPEAQLEGRLSGWVEFHWGDRKAGVPTMSLKGEISGIGLVVAGPWLEGDRLRLERLDAPVSLVMAGSQLRIERAELQCELGKASISGAVDTDQFEVAALARCRYQAAADVDLARLANLLPNTLHLRPETRITSGRLHLDVSSASGPQGPTWQGRLQASDLKAVRKGQQIVLPEPIAIAFSAHEPPNAALVLDSCRCESSFLNLEGSGTVDRLTASASADLSRLTAQLSSLVDLGPLRLAGQGSARLMLERGPEGGFVVHGEAQVRQLQMTGFTNRLAHPVQEELLTLRLDATGRTLENGGQRLDSANLRLEGGREVVEAQLLEPIADLQHGRLGAVRVQVQGDLAAWQRRWQPWSTSLDGWHLAGTGGLSARLRSTASAIAVEELKLTLRNVSCQDAEISIEEPAIDLETAGSWQKGTRTLELTGTRLASATLSVQAPRLHVLVPEDGAIEVAGSATMQGDLGRLQRWTRSPNVFLAGIDRGPITPASCVKGLKYLAPVLAGAAEAEGRFSATLETIRVPFANPAAVALGGKLTIHSARLGAGPLVRELGVLLKDPPTVSIARESVVTFYVVNGQVHHRDLEFGFPDLTIRTSGSVGFDGSLALMAEMPVPPKWLGAGKVSAAFAKQTIRIPIGGTLEKPKLDQQVLRQVSAQFMRDTTGGLLRQEADKQLQKLIHPRR